MNDTRRTECLPLKIITIFLKSFSTELRFSTLQEHMFKIIQRRFKLEKALKYVCETQRFSPKRNYVHCFDMSVLDMSALSSLSFVSSSFSYLLSTSFPLQQQALNKQEYHIGQQHVWLRSEGRSPRAGEEQETCTDHSAVQQRSRQLPLFTDTALKKINPAKWIYKMAGFVLQVSLTHPQSYIL